MTTAVSLTVTFKFIICISFDEVKDQSLLALDHTPTSPAGHPTKRAPSTPVAAATIKRQRKVEMHLLILLQTVIGMI